MLIITALLLLFIFLGILEKNKHQKNLNKIPFIIHVNGIRGKSSTTRLIAGALKAGGIKVMAKTTGTAARIIYPNDREKEIKRCGLPSIAEQKKIVKLAAGENVDVLVIECMAISPEIQWASENEFLQADLTIITNIREDHKDKMGENIEEISKTICLSLPLKAKVISTERKMSSLIEKYSLEKKNEFYQLEELNLKNHEKDKFENTIFEANIACALKAASFFGINRNKALTGMAAVDQDPGQLNYFQLNDKNRKIIFINAFAANDPESTEIIWKQLLKNDFNSLITTDTVIKYALISHRSDRSFRLKSFSKFLTQKNKFDGFILSGALKARQKWELKNNLTEKYPIIKLNPSSLFQNLEKFFKSLERGNDLIIFGCGNIHGDGEKILNFFEENGVEL